MSRLGYIILALAVAALVGYVFWPASSEDDVLERPWSGGTDFPTRYQVRLGDLRQEVDVPKVMVQGVERHLDAGLHERLWNRIRIICARRDRVVRDVAPDRLAAYGIGEDRRITCDAMVLGWARSEAGGYVWEGRSRRIFAVDRETIHALDVAAGRLDDRLLLPMALSCSGLVVDGLTLAKDAAGHWTDQANPFRPHFDLRVASMLELVRNAQLDRFDLSVPADATPVGRMALTIDKRGVQEVTVHQQGEVGWLRIGAAPPQPLDATALAAWRMAFTDMRGDMLYDIELRAADSPLVEVHASRAGRRLFRLEKHGVNDVDRDGSSRWDVVWDGGRETAADDAAAKLAQACDRLLVERVAPRGDAPEPADAIVFEFVFHVRSDRLRVVLVPRTDGWEAWSGTHRGRALDPPRLLTDPQAEDCLDTALSHRPAFRVAKVQRQVGDGQGGSEVFVSEQGQGAWRRTFPADQAGLPVNQLAVDRLVRSLCTARGRSVRLLRLEDRAIIERPAFAIAMRFVPVVARRSEDGVRLGDTLDQDWQVSFGKGADGWRAVDRDGGVSWLMEDELIDLLRQPLDDTLVFPIVASLVRRVDIVGSQGRFRIEEDGGQWRLTVFDADGGSNVTPADAVEVRRYLRTLSGLRAQRRGGKGPIPADQVTGSVVCTLPDVGDEKAQAALTLGRAIDGLVPVAAITSREDQHLGNDLMLVAPADMAALLPAPTAFAVADLPR